MDCELLNKAIESHHLNFLNHEQYPSPIHSCQIMVSRVLQNPNCWFVQHTTAGWWLTYPSEKHESQLGLFFYMENKSHVPNHQPDDHVHENQSITYQRPISPLCLTAKTPWLWWLSYKSQFNSNSSPTNTPLLDLTSGLKHTCMQSLERRNNGFVSDTNSK